MSDGLDLIANEAISLLDDIPVFQAIATMVQNEAQLVPKVQGVTSALELLDKLASDINSPEIAEAFALAGLADTLTQLKAFVAKVSGVAGKIPDNYKNLLRRVGDYAVGTTTGQIKWSVAHSDAPVVKSSDYALNLGAAASLTFSPDSSWPDDKPAARRLTVEGTGSVDGDGSVTLPYTVGSVKVGATANASLDVIYYFTAADDEIVALALVERLADLANPFDLNSVFAKLQGPNLDGVTLTFGGSASGSVTIALADSFSLADGVKAALGGNVAVTAGLERKYMLSLRRAKAPDGTFGVKVHLSRNSASSSEFAASLGLDVDYSALTKPVTDALTYAIDAENKALQTIKPFLSPGTWLQDNAKELIGEAVAGIVSDAGLRAALVNDANRAIGIPDVSSDGLTQWLNNRIGSAIDNAGVVATGDLQTAAKQVLANITAVSPALAALAEQKLTDLAAKAVQTIDQGIKDKVADILKDPEAKLDAALKAVGVAVQGDLGKADDALKNVRALVDKIDTNFRKLMTTATNALKQKASAKLSLTETSSDGTVVEVSGTITKVDDDTTAAFGALITGRLQDLVDLVDTKKVLPNFQIDPSSSITRFSKFHSEAGLDIVFLGIELKAGEVVDIGATTVVDSLGNIHVNTQAALTKSFSSPFDSRDVSFVDGYALVRAAQLAAAGDPPSLDVGIGASYQDGSLERGHIASFAAGLVAAKLLSQHAVTAAQAAFDGWSKAGNGKIAGGLAASLRLSAAQIGTLLDKKNFDAGGSLIVAQKKAIVTKALAALQRAPGAMNPQQFLRGCKLALAHFLGAPDNLAIEDIVLDYPVKIGPLERPRNDVPPSDKSNAVPIRYVGKDAASQTDYEYFFKQAYALQRVVDLVDTMGHIYFSQTWPGPGGWTPQNYRQAQLALVMDCRYWITVGGSVADLFKPDVTPRTVAFMRTIADLAGAPGVVLTLTRDKTDTDPAQTLAFV